MDAAWLAAVAVVALVSWSVGRNQRSSEKRASNGHGRASEHPQTAVTKPAPAGSKASGAPGSLARIPSFIDDDGDDVDVTLVTASPFRDPGRRGAEPAESAGAVSQQFPPTVNVLYEDDAELDEVTSPNARILVSAEGQSDCGHVRKRNEDSLLVFPEFSLYAVADGMGGYAGGDVASGIAVQTLRTAYETGSFEAHVEAKKTLPRRGREIACAIQMANHAIIASAKTDPALADMGTTMVAARFSPNKQRVYIGHVGDSRCYRLRGSTLRQLTTDHTMGELGMKGPGAKQLFQAVGQKAEIAIDLVVDKPQPEDVYLLCSDGLSKMVTDEQVRDVLVREADLEAAVYSLVELANDAGGKDNVTVILIKVVQRISRGARAAHPA